MNICRKLSCASRLILLSFLFNCQLQGQSGADPSLKLHFDFDENFANGRVVDVSSNGSDGVQFDSTNWITASNGVFGSTAAQFTYVGLIYTDPPRVHPYSQYISVTNVNAFYYLTNGTMSVWAKIDTNSDNSMYLLSAGYPAMYAWDQNAATNSWTWNRDSASYFSFITYPDGIYKRDVLSWPDDTIQPGGYTPILATTNFHMYSVTIDCPNNECIAYYDGEPYMTNTIDQPWIRVYGTINDPWLCVGAMGHDGTPEWGDDAYPNAGFFVGQMDDLRIYNRTLAASEIQALYLGFGSKAWNPPLRINNTGSQSVQVSFQSMSNVSYAVDYRPALNAGAWSPLMSPIPGNGGTNSVVDSVTGQTSRFYRVHPLP